MIEERREKIAKTRGETCAWLKSKKLNYIDPQANFMMVDTGRDIKQMGPAMLAKGVAIGRPFPPYNNMMRVTIGTDADMAKFRSALGEVLGV
jgi:histidinol-phosphate aminotransferase